MSINQGQIRLLDSHTANQIAAGEVVERPQSVIKELIENAIDAAASRIDIKIFNPDCTKLQIVDNGRGMIPEDMRMAIQRHATSKIRKLADLDNILSLGFRGEALPSIASVSKMTITSKVENADHAFTMQVSDGRATIPEPTAGKNGTLFLIDQLFYNAPARKKFLKSSRWELGLIIDTVQKMALANPFIAFSLVQGNKKIFTTDGRGDLNQVLAAIYGREILGKMLAVDYQEGNFKVNGLISLPDLSRSNRNNYTFFVNNRWLKSRELSQMIDDAYYTLLPAKRYPIIVLNLELSPDRIDINVHPAKMEVKFAEPSFIKEQMAKAIQQSFYHQEALAPRLATKNSPQYETNISSTNNIDLEPTFSKLEAFNEDVVRCNTKYRLGEAKSANLDFQTLGTTLSRLSSNIAYEQPKQEPESASFAQGNQMPQQAFKQKASSVDYQQKVVFDLQNENYDIAKKRLLKFSELQVLGQLEGSFIVAAEADGLLLIDQHAAHERVLFERIAAQAKTKSTDSNMLALPLNITLSAEEHIWLTEAILHLNDLGFVLEFFGDNDYLIRGVPLWYQGAEPEEFLRSLLHSLAETEADISRLRKEQIFMMACKKAIKANRYLTKADISALFNDLDNCENAATCPHGRPLAIKIATDEIRKRFLR